MKFADLVISDTFTAELDSDPLTPEGPIPHVFDESNNSNSLVSESTIKTSRMVQNSFFTFLLPETVQETRLVIASPSSLNLLDVDFEESNTDYFQGVVCGKYLLDEELCKPWAAAYAGHQFGYYAGQLGDGRVISLFETINSKKMRLEITIKGAGRTPFSRFGDGLCSISQCIREYVISEFLNLLNIPTVRSLAITQVTGRKISRDDIQDSGILTRVAPTWIRFGTFELFYYRGQRNLVRKLADYLLKYHFTDCTEIVKLDFTCKLQQSAFPIQQPPSLRAKSAAADRNLRSAGAVNENKEMTVKIGLNRYSRMFQSIVKKTAILIASWQAYGFVHGVLNTDNMSILGLGLNYSCFGFMESYDPSWNSNISDLNGRYSFNNQPRIALWNLSKLGRCFVDLVKEPLSNGIEILPELITGYDITGFEIIKHCLEDFEPVFIEHYTDLMRKKLGLNRALESDLRDLISPLMDLFTETGCDYHDFFHVLSHIDGLSNIEGLESLDNCRLAMVESLTSIKTESKRNSLSNIQVSLQGSNKQNPNEPISPVSIKDEFFPRKLTLEQFDERFNNWKDKFVKRVEEEKLDRKSRFAAMKKVNPKHVPINSLIKECIEAFNSGDFEAVSRFVSSWQ